MGEFMAKKDYDELSPWEKAQQQTNRKNKLLTKKRRTGTRKPKTYFKKFQFDNLHHMKWILSFLSIILVILIYLVSPLSKVNEIKITGNYLISNSQLNKAIGIKTGDSLLTVWGHQSKIEQTAHDKNPRIRSVQIHTYHLNNLNLKVKEYPTIGYLYKDGGYQQILSNGVIISDKVLNPNENYPVIKNFKDSKQVKAIIKQYKNISPSIRSNILSISLSKIPTNSDRIILMMGDGNIVYGTIGTISKKMQYYPSITSKLKVDSVIDMQVGAYSYPIKNNYQNTAANSK